jgi:uncharacterized protein YxeA
MVKRLFILTSLLICSLKAWPQDSTSYDQENPYLRERIEKKSFDEEEWKKTTKKLNYVVKEQKKPQRKTSKKSKPFTFNSKQAAFWLRFFLIVLVAVGLIALLYALFNRPGNRKVEAPVLNINLETIEDNLETTELQYFIQRAIETGDFQLAIRLYFLETLKQLSLQQLIRFKKNKTNHAYLLELRKSQHYGAFHELSLIFDRIRYGGQALDGDEFWRVEPKFRLLVQQLSNSGSMPKAITPA